jgi:hypothetical protein
MSEREGIYSHTLFTIVKAALHRKQDSNSESGRQTGGRVAVNSDLISASERHKSRTDNQKGDNEREREKIVTGSVDGHPITLPIPTIPPFQEPLPGSIREHGQACNEIVLPDAFDLLSVRKILRSIVSDATKHNARQRQHLRGQILSTHKNFLRVKGGEGGESTETRSVHNKEIAKETERR